MSCYIIELADCALTPYAIETESGTEYGWGLMPKRKVDLDELLRVADECDAADVDGVTDWAARIRKAVGELPHRRADNDGRPQRQHGDRIRHGGHAQGWRRRAVGVPVSACTLLVRCGCAGGGKGALVSDEVSLTLSTSNTQTLFSEEGGGMVVRRLTPRECERLQGFPDDWTRIPYRGKPADECPDGPRYKAVGNSMAVPVMRWIGERIAMAEAGEIS